jgi:hypothetical protein
MIITIQWIELPLAVIGCITLFLLICRGIDSLTS